MLSLEKQRPQSSSSEEIGTNDENQAWTIGDHLTTCERWMCGLFVLQGIIEVSRVANEQCSWPSVCAFCKESGTNQLTVSNFVAKSQLGTARKTVLGNLTLDFGFDMGTSGRTFGHM
ncbi:hypothetical protein IGI04_006119 [Brassica rapa subsp. trilocularis]|uniref:Uncharacterized protein n=1 Tax=Brassica rapa subsp. trilocularis TaxID=1813537 RepID=A0ABQ7NFZ2_BRACM|nr:hypothetical protein IGI04_006119 [Brassica rapa subsp. trilocularis]